MRVSQVEINKAVHAGLGGGELRTADGRFVSIRGQQKVFVVVMMKVRARMVRVLVVRVRPSMIVVVQIVEAVERAAAARSILVQIMWLV